ncbi:MAG TPA: tetratricopeptide repeat protein, partial [Candidatus Krumholzibacteria bacterium]|nr:tetratricopeptide repeat protein [Candidatus Krumholzibacteria bacterium]
MRFPGAVFFLGTSLLLLPAPAARAQADARDAPPILREAPPDSSGASVRRLRALQNAKLLAARGRSEEAISELENYLKANGEDRIIVRELVSLYQDARRFNDLEKLLKLQIERSEGVDVGALRLLAQAQLELGKDDEAIANLQKILKAHPDELSYARMVATVLGRYKHDEDALAVLLQARKQSGDSNALAQQLGATYLRMNKPVEAATEYLRVVLDTPMNVELMRAQILDIRDAHPKAA